MKLETIPFDQFVSRPFGMWENQHRERQWFLLTSGDYAAGQYNCMTVSWGSMGFLWGHPFVMVVVRPQRYTLQFMEKYPTFTLCAFPLEYHDALNLLGTRSGRDGDKISAAGLTPIAATKVAAPIYEQAELAIECRKVYWQDLDPTHFLDPEINRNYPRKDYHRIYYGEVVAVAGVSAYQQRSIRLIIENPEDDSENLNE
jgi:flavin reductase (DIM6/NTAB) family NADH-FMN oxidoreductase RutF